MTRHPTGILFDLLEEFAASQTDVDELAGLPLLCLVEFTEQPLIFGEGKNEIF